MAKKRSRRQICHLGRASEEKGNPLRPPQTTGGSSDNLGQAFKEGYGTGEPAGYVSGVSFEAVLNI